MAQAAFLEQLVVRNDHVKAVLSELILGYGRAQVRIALAEIEREAAALGDTIRVTFFEAGPSIEIGGRHIVSGVPARLLRACLRIACAEGRREFAFREFKRMPELISHPKNTGFEVRLKRLREALLEANCGLTIEATGRGRFALLGGARLLLDERAPESHIFLAKRRNLRP